jgi:hypothetical protein
MPTVTFDTILAERADVAALLDEAHQEGLDIAAVEVRQLDIDPQRFCESDELEGNIWYLETHSSIEIRLSRLARNHGGGQVAMNYIPVAVGILGIWCYALRYDPTLPFDWWWEQDDLLDNWHDPNPILHIISGGASVAPGFWTPHAPIQTRQVRAALVLLAHACGRRDIFITDNIHAFIHAGRRQALERLLATRIMTADEFFTYLAKRRRTKARGRK